MASPAPTALRKKRSSRRLAPLRLLPCAALTVAVARPWLQRATAPTRVLIGHRPFRIVPCATIARHAADRSEASAVTEKVPEDWFSFSSSVEIVGARASDAYAVYSHLPNHPQWSSLLTEVQMADSNKTSTWCLKALGISFSWTAETTQEIPPELITWKSTSGLPNKGAATFVELPSRSGVPVCRVQVEMNIQTPGLLKRVFQSRRLSAMAESAIGRDLRGFRDVVLACEAASDCVIKEDFVVVNSTHKDAVGSCQVTVRHSGRLDFELRGFGTAGSTRKMLDDCSEAMAQLDDSTNCSAMIDMARGVGCSPMAVPSIVNFLQREGGRIKHTAVLGPRPLMTIAQVISRMAGQPGVAFFSDKESAEEWCVAPP